MRTRDCWKKPTKDGIAASNRPMHKLNKGLWSHLVSLVFSAILNSYFKLLFTYLLFINSFMDSTVNFLIAKDSVEFFSYEMLRGSVAKAITRGLWHVNSFWLSSIWFWFKFIPVSIAVLSLAEETYIHFQHQDTIIYTISIQKHTSLKFNATTMHLMYIYMYI